MTDEPLIDDLPYLPDWRKRYEDLAKEAWEIFGIVYAQLTDTERDMDAEERIVVAANELHEAAKRLQAREIFDHADL